MYQIPANLHQRGVMSRQKFRISIKTCIILAISNKKNEQNEQMLLRINQQIDLS